MTAPTNPKTSFASCSINMSSSFLAATLAAALALRFTSRFFSILAASFLILTQR